MVTKKMYKEIYQVFRKVRNSLQQSLGEYYRVKVSIDWRSENSVIAKFTVKWRNLSTCYRAICIDFKEMELLNDDIKRDIGLSITRTLEKELRNRIYVPSINDYREYQVHW